MAESYSEWSGTFVRVRAEMMISALLLLAFVVWPVDLTHIPLLGIQTTTTGSSTLAVSLPKWQIIDPLILFYLYSLLVFVVRHRVESNRLLNPAQRYDQVTGNLNDFTAELRAVDLTARIPEFVDAIGKLNVQSTLEGYNPQNYFNNSIASLQAAIDKARMPSLDDNRLREALMSSLLNFNTEQASRVQERAREAIKAQFKESSDALNAQADQLTQLLSDLRLGHIKYEQMGAGLTAIFSALIAELRDLQNRQSVGLTTAIATATAAIEAAKRELNGARTAEMFDRNLLSFWVPLIAAGASALVAVGLGWRTAIGLA